MKSKVKNKLKLAIIDHMTQISFKSFLECNDDVYDMYENGYFNDVIFYDIVDEIKNEAIKYCIEDSCDDISDICESNENNDIVVEEIKEVYDNKYKVDYNIRNLYFKVKEDWLSPVKRFGFVYNDECGLQLGDIIIIFSEGDEINIKKLEDVKNEYAENFVYFLDHDIIITDN